MPPHMSNVGYTQGFVFIIILFLNRCFKSAPLQAWAQLSVVWGKKGNSRQRSSAATTSSYSTGAHNTRQHCCVWKGQRPRSSLLYDGRACPTLENFLQIMLCLPYRGFMHLCCPRFLFISIWPLKNCYWKKRTKTSLLTFLDSPSMHDHKRSPDPWTNCSFW